MQIHSDGTLNGTLYAALAAKAERVTRALFRHRDRYVKAWSAQTGIKPTDAVLVERQAWDASASCMVAIVEIMTKEEATRRFG